MAVHTERIFLKTRDAALRNVRDAAKDVSAMVMHIHLACVHTEKRFESGVKNTVKGHYISMENYLEKVFLSL